MKPTFNHKVENEWLKLVRERVEPLGYGSVEIVIHDSRIVQIDTTQRWRFPENFGPRSERTAAAVLRAKSTPDSVQNT